MRSGIMIVAAMLVAGLGHRDRAVANDSVAHLAAGGLVLARTQDIEMMSEDLFISADEVRVQYRFRNRTDRDITTLVAFPMPELRAPSDVDNFVIPVAEKANFLGFETRVGGKPVAVEVEQRAHALGIDRSNLLQSLGVPLEPQFEATKAALTRLSPGDQERLQRFGMLAFDEYDAGQGMTRHPRPLWSLATTYYWSQTFPASAAVTVSHRYTPSVGGTAQTFIGADFATEAMNEDYRRRYCIDAPFERAVRRAQNRSKGKAILGESWLEYVLVTGANWAGSIGKFRLVVDKGSPDNLVSFCGEGVTRISPTQFEMTKTDYWPDSNLAILILRPIDMAQ